MEPGATPRGNMEQTTKARDIPAYNYDALAEAVEKMNRRAVKLG